MAAELREAVQGHLDRSFFIETLRELIKVPTEVPLGPDTLIDPDDPKLVHYVQSVLRPMLEDARIYEILEMPLNQLVVKMGSGEKDDSLLIQAYTPTQHQNLMEDPFVPRIAHAPEHGFDEPCIFGQGISQNKLHQAAMITVLKAIVDSGEELSGTLYFAINNEGRSSHECSEALIPKLDPNPQYGLLLLGGLNISIANRGRVDVYVHVHGKAAHSSSPWNGNSAIDGANEVINRIGAMEFDKTHPNLGGQHAVPYQVVYWPLAPHTLPEYAKITVDRRLLPGDDIDEAVQEIEDAIGDMSPFEVEVERGVHMLPAEVDPDAPIVNRLSRAQEEVRGEKPDLLYKPGAFDAGGPCALGVPTVQWGAGAGDGLLGDDLVPLSDAWDEVNILAKLIVDWLA